MIQDFESYTRGERLTVGAGFTPAVVWVKKYPGGETARLLVQTSGITRAIVREAFEAQEAGLSINLFLRKDANYRWMERVL